MYKHVLTDPPKPVSPPPPPQPWTPQGPIIPPSEFTPSSSVSPEIEVMVQQVTAVLPQVPHQVIRKDLCESMGEAVPCGRQGSSRLLFFLCYGFFFLFTLCVCGMCSGRCFSVSLFSDKIEYFHFHCKKGLLFVHALYYRPPPHLCIAYA